MELKSEMATAIEGGIVPRFMESGRRHGRFHLSCVDHASFSWLKMTVDKLSVRSDSGVEDQLLLMTPSQLPRLLRAEVYVSGKPPTVAQFKTFLQAQNDGLHTERWALRHQHTTTKGMLMVWNIDHESAVAMAAVEDHLYYGLGRVTFRVARAGTQSAEDK